MKAIFSTLFLCFSLLGVANAQTPAPVQGGNEPVSAVKFDQVNFDFGKIDYSSEGTHTFTFKNTSKTPVVLKNVTASCGCTTPSFSKEPIMPGQSGTVTAKYDTTRVGPFSKSLTVYINDEVLTLSIKGDVKEQAAQGAPQAN